MEIVSAPANAQRPIKNHARWCVMPRKDTACVKIFLQRTPVLDEFDECDTVWVYDDSLHTREENQGRFD